MLHEAICLSFFDEKWAACAPGWDIFLAGAYAFDKNSFTIQVGRKGVFFHTRKTSTIFVSLPFGMNADIFLDL